MDAIDRRIIRALQLDGRMKIGELAELVGLSATPCARRLERLQEDGVITGYGARVDPRKNGGSGNDFCLSGIGNSGR